MDFKNQVTNLKITTITKPRVYLQWTNTEDGRDKNDCYERIENGYVIYVNTYNRSSSITKGHPFFEILEEMYLSALVN